jgi:hypothetical protein
MICATRGNDIQLSSIAATLGIAGNPQGERLVGASDTHLSPINDKSTIDKQLFDGISGSYFELGICE